jgi:crotonobetainyl-CoA:carnitine CoA-transferase CaiB-like acyl-CoA transferase
MAAGPLDGVRVLDLTRVLTGPYATLLLADLGAEVIKVERLDLGDETRIIPPRRDGESHYFLSVNRNKKGIAVDLKHPRGRDLVRDLALHSDVLVENFRPGVTRRLGLDAETLGKLNPRLVYCSISAFGQTGPWAERSAFDIALQAISGAMSVTGEAGGRPVRMGLPMADLAASIYAALGVSAALVERDRTGRGQAVDVSMMDGMVALLTNVAGAYFMTGRDPVPEGSGHDRVAPYGSFQASDGDIVIANLGESFWPKIAAAIGRPELATDQRYATNIRRVERREEVQELVAAAIRQRTVAEWAAIFEANDVPHAPVLKVSEVLEHPQARARGMVTEVDHPTIGRWPALGRPIKLPSHPDFAYSPSPLLGEHTREVLSQVLGLDNARIESLIEERAVQAADR